MLLVFLIFFFPILSPSRHFQNPQATDPDDGTRRAEPLTRVPRRLVCVPYARDAAPRVWPSPRLQARHAASGRPSPRLPPRDAASR